MSSSYSAWDRIRARWRPCLHNEAWSEQGFGFGGSRRIVERSSTMIALLNRRSCLRVSFRRRRICHEDKPTLSREVLPGSRWYLRLEFHFEWRTASTSFPRSYPPWFPITTLSISTEQSADSQNLPRRAWWALKMANPSFPVWYPTSLKLFGACRRTPSLDLTASDENSQTTWGRS